MAIVTSFRINLFTHGFNLKYNIFSVPSPLLHKPYALSLSYEKSFTILDHILVF